VSPDFRSCSTSSPRSVSQLQSAFREPDYPGPDGYARERYPLLAAGDEEFEQARNTAYATVSHFVELLRSRLWE